MVLADRGDQDVLEAVVVVVGDGDAHAVEIAVQSRGRGDILEVPLPLLR